MGGFIRLYNVVYMCQTCHDWVRNAQNILWNWTFIQWYDTSRELWKKRAGRKLPAVLWKIINIIDWFECYYLQLTTCNTRWGWGSYTHSPEVIPEKYFALHMVIRGDVMFILKLYTHQ